MADLAFTVDYGDIQTLRRELVGIAKDAKSSASVFEREFAKAEKILVRNAKASQEYYKGILSIDNTTKSAAKSAAIFEKELIKTEQATKQNTAAIIQFKSAYDRSFATEQKVLQLKQLLRQEIANGNMTVRQAGAELLNYRKSLIAFNQSQASAIAGMNNTGVWIQQLGYQAGDFIVQVQSGTNAFVAFGQQATQMAGFLPAIAQSFGAATIPILGFNVAIAPLTLGLSIIIPLLTAAGAAFMRTGEESSKSKDKLTEYEQQVKSLKETLLDYERTKEALAQGKTVDEVLGAKELESAQKALQNAADHLERIRNIQEESGGTMSAIIGLFAETRDAVTSLTAAEEAYADAKELVLDIERRMLDTYTEEYQSLRSRMQLEQARLQYGEDSYKVRELEAAAERKTYEASLLRAGLSQNLISSLMREYDVLVKSKNQTEETRRQAETLRSVLEDLHGKEFKAKLIVSANLPDWVTGVSNRLAAIQGGFDPNNIPKPRRAPMEGEILGEVSGGGSGGGGGEATQTQEEYIQQLIREDEQKRKLIGLTDKEASASENEFKVREKLRDLKGSVTEEEIQSTLRQMEATQKLIEQEKQREAMIESVASTVESAFMSMIDGSKSVADAFKGMIRDILLDVYRQNVVSPIGDMVSGALKGIFQANGGAWSNGVQMFANGGVVGSPTLFGHRGGLGMMGEAGPEAIMPLKRGKNGKLGVQMDGANNGAISVNNNITVTGSDAAMVRAEVAKMIPQITNATKSAIIDSRLRGGQMKQAFR